MEPTEFKKTRDYTVGKDPVAKRIRLLENADSIGDNHASFAALDSIHRASLVYAKAIADAVESRGHDVGRLIAAIDRIHEAQRAAMDAIILASL